MDQRDIQLMLVVGCGLTLNMSEAEGGIVARIDGACAPCHLCLLQRANRTVSARNLIMVMMVVRKKVRSGIVKDETRMARARLSAITNLKKVTQKKRHQKYTLIGNFSGKEAQSAESGTRSAAEATHDRRRLYFSNAHCHRFNRLLSSSTLYNHIDSASLPSSQLGSNAEEGKERIAPSDSA